jgi:hypothetical protein
MKAGALGDAAAWRDEMRWLRHAYLDCMGDHPTPFGPRHRARGVKGPG